MHQALKDLLTSADKTIGGDVRLRRSGANAALQSALNDVNIYVQMSLDSSQAAGKAERPLLASWDNDKIGNSIAIGHSEKSAIMH